jgi:osmotically-inducible protein OsmY
MITLKTRVAKTDVKTDILQALHRYADLEMSQIDLNISGGRVTISGDVHAWNERKLIEDAVWSSPGVTEVIDNLRVT